MLTTASSKAWSTSSRQTGIQTLHYSVTFLCSFPLIILHFFKLYEVLCVSGACRTVLNTYQRFFCDNGVPRRSRACDIGLYSYVDRWLAQKCVNVAWCSDSRLLDWVWNVMAHAQKPDFVFRRNGRVYLNGRGASVQSTTGSRGVRIRSSNAGIHQVPR